MHHDDQKTSGIAVADEGDGTLVTLWGEIDVALRDEASTSMVQVLQRGGPVVVDLSGVTFIDSSGLAYVIQLYRMGEEGDQPCTLRNPPEHVTYLLEMIGLGGRIPVEGQEPAGDAAAAPVVAGR